MSATTQEQRRHEQREQARRVILDATEGLLVEEGGVSIRALVKRCGYTAPTIYNHFGDKEGLIDALLDARFETLVRKLKRVSRENGPEAYIRGLTLAFIRFGQRNPSHYQLLIAPRAQDHTPPPSAEEARETLERAWSELWEAGRIRAGDWRSASQALWAMASGIISGQIARPDQDWSKTLPEDAVDALLRGLIAPESEARPEGRHPKDTR
jgi:AcrR family transcriptional regulator